MTQPTAHERPYCQYDHDNEATAHAAAAALAPAVFLGSVRVVVPGLGRVAAVERAAVHTLTRRRAAVAAVVGAGGIVEGNVTGPIPGRRALVDVEERVVARRLGAACVSRCVGSMACCGLRRRKRTITRATGAVAAVRRLEISTGAPRAAVPVVAGRSEAGSRARVAGGGREPRRPQQQNMYNGAGSRVGHGEYVQLTWLVSG